MPKNGPWNLAPSADGSTLEISLFGTIGADWFGPSVDEEIAAQLAENRGATKINVSINSEGGDMFAGIAIYNLLRKHGAQVTCTVEGLAASAASIVAMAGRTVMGRGSMMMVHNPWAIAMGSADDLRSTADMLDKAAASLVSIYEAKTGKAAGELQALLDAETWMTADEAVAAGFADEVADKPLAVENRADSVLLNQIAFPRERVPGRILAMAKPAPAPVPVAPHVVEPAAEQHAVSLLLPIVDVNAIAAARSVLSAEAPALIASLVNEGRAAGIAAERARLQAIDDLDVRGHADLVSAAKYGPAPSTAEALAVAVLKAERQIGADRIAARARDSSVLAGINPVSPEQSDRMSRDAEERAAAKQIAAVMNDRRGGARR